MVESLFQTDAALNAVSDFFISIKTVIGAMPWLLDGCLITICTVNIALAVGFLFGVPFAVLQLYAPRPIRRLIGLYVWFFRGVPILVQLFLFYFGLAYQLGLSLTPFVASCLVLGLTSTAYQSQIFRGALGSLPEGQLKAAKALGMSTPKAIRVILLPQALRLAIPAWSNEFSILLKDSALVSVLGTFDLMARTKAIATSTAEYAAFYIAAAVLYFIITFIGNALLRKIASKVSVPGLSHQGMA